MSAIVEETMLNMKLAIHSGDVAVLQKCLENSLVEKHYRKHKDNLINDLVIHPTDYSVGFNSYKLFTDTLGKWDIRLNKNQTYSLISDFANTLNEYVVDNEDINTIELYELASKYYYHLFNLSYLSFADISLSVLALLIDRHNNLGIVKQFVCLDCFNPSYSEKLMVGLKYPFVKAAQYKNSELVKYLQTIPSLCIVDEYTLSKKRTIL